MNFITKLRKLFSSNGRAEPLCRKAAQIVIEKGEPCCIALGQARHGIRNLHYCVAVKDEPITTDRIPETIAELQAKIAECQEHIWELSMTPSTRAYFKWKKEVLGLPREERRPDLKDAWDAGVEWARKNPTDVNQ